MDEYKPVTGINHEIRLLMTREKTEENQMLKFSPPPSSRTCRRLNGQPPIPLVSVNRPRRTVKDR